MEEQRLNVEELKQALAGDFDRLVEGVVQAMNAAKAGRIIADTEEPVRDALGEFRQRAYARALRLLQDKQEAFSPSARRPAEQRQTTDHLCDG
jgi:hypothetical protein